MRRIDEIIVHCSATKPKVDIGAKEIKQWHMIDNGWGDIGYHYVIRLDGKIEKGRPEYRQGAHCYGHNKHSIGVCYVGGLDQNGVPADTRTPEQKGALCRLLKELCAKYRCKIHGHNEYSNKKCPCFNAFDEYKEIWWRFWPGGGLPKDPSKPPIAPSAQ